VGGVGAKKLVSLGPKKHVFVRWKKRMVMMFWVFLLHDRKKRARSKWWIVGTIITNIADF
jgi:hypothetical protein